MKKNDVRRKAVSSFLWLIGKHYNSYVKLNYRARESLESQDLDQILLMNVELEKHGIPPLQYNYTEYSFVRLLTVGTHDPNFDGRAKIKSPHLESRRNPGTKSWSNCENWYVFDANFLLVDINVPFFFTSAKIY